MVRVVKGSLIILLHGLDVDRAWSVIEGLHVKGFKTITVSTQSTTVYARGFKSKGIHLHAIPPLSIILPPGYEPVDLPLDTILVVERDTWIDTGSIDLDLYVNIYSRVMDVVNGLIQDFTVNTGKYTLIFQRTSDKCTRLLYMDGLNTQYSWVTGRFPYDQDVYKAVLKDLTSRKPVENILCYIIMDGLYKPMVVHRPESKIIMYSIPCECPGLREYLFWNLIDVLIN